MPTVAILGTGKMGSAMARRLASSGFELSLWNRTRTRAEELGLGRVAATPAEAVRDAEVVITSLTNAQAVRDVYLGERGVLGSSAGKLLIDASTVGPAVAEELGRAAAAKGARFLEAPVIGSVPAVETGRLLILVGGAQTDLERAQPVLEQLGEILYVGEWGGAQRLKLIANSMLGISSAAAAELLGAGTAIGLDRQQVFSILVRFAPGLAAREAGFVHEQYRPTMFAVRDLVKDLDLGLRIYGEKGARTPLTQESRDLYTAAMPESSELDIAAIVRVSG
jgi:3-hydroxyisobutyrate dehydrogenase-like beta-hydroxyacid dehydrogenase